MKRLITFLLALMLTWIGASAQTITSGGTYMLQNVETGYFLGGANAWGTQGSLLAQPQQFVITSTTTADTYTLTSYQWRESYHSFGSNGYTDSDPGNWKIELVDGATDVYTIYSGGTDFQYLTGTTKNGACTSSTSATATGTQWRLITQDDIRTSQANLSSGSVDVTGLINNPTLNQYSESGSTDTHWTNTQSNVAVGYCDMERTNTTGNCAEAYHGAFDWSQKLENMKAGVYILSAQAFHRDDDSQSSYDAPVMYVTIGNVTSTANIPNLTSASGTTTSFSGTPMRGEAYVDFLAGLYPVSIQFTVDTDDTDVTIGFGLSGEDVAHEWVCWGELNLTYYGEELDYAIGEPECSVTSVTPGSDVSITFPNCVTPNEGETPTLNTTNKITVNDTAVDATLSYSGTTATVTFTMPETVERGTTVAVVVPQGLVEWSGQSVSSPAEAVTFYLSTPVIEDQTAVYLVNAYMMQFLSRGANGGHTTDGVGADVDLYGIPVDIEANSEGKFTIKYIDSQLYVGGPNWSISNASAADATQFEVAEQTSTYTLNGVSYPAYTFSSGTFTNNSGSTEDYYLYVYVKTDGTSDGVAINGNIGGDNNLSSDMTRAHWLILTKDQRDAVKAANVLAAKLAVATSFDNSFNGTTEEEFDAFIAGLNSEACTSKVNGARLSSSTDLGKWTEEDVSVDSGDNGFVAANDVIETYEDVDDLTQTITGLDAGIYKVTLQGFNRMGSGPNVVNNNVTDYDMSIATLSANGEEINLKAWATGGYDYSEDHYVPNNTTEAYNLFNAGEYQNELYVYVDGTESLTITITCPDYLGADWVAFTHMTLTRYYTEDTYIYDVTSLLANPSFEEDDVTDLTADTNEGGTSRCDSNKDGAWTITSLTGWDLTAATGGVSDLMSAKAVATDNNFGAPGEPADGTYMLYLRDAWNVSTGSVKQSVALPAGSYKLTVDSKCVTLGDGHSATLVVGESSNTLSIHPSYMAGELDWDTSSLTFEVEDGDNVIIGVEASFANVSGLSVLLDNFRLYSSTVASVEWTMTEAQWGTIILPFDAEIPTADNEGNEIEWTAYSTGTVTLDDDESGNATLSLTEESSAIKANTPYIMAGTEGTYTFSGTPVATTGDLTQGLLTGTFTELKYDDLIALNGTVYLLQNHEDDGGVAFYPVVESLSSDATLTPYHCYLTTSSGSGVRAHIDFPSSDNEATAIVAVESAEAEGNGAIYDLSGRKVSKAVKGVYIQNGKKVLVK